METKKKIKNAFTIVELLTVISIIALIIGLLVPALNQVNRIAKDTKQKAQFHAITTGLEMFKTENGSLPESQKLPLGPPSGDIICGAHRLAEALLGRDLQGFDPISSWYPPDDAATDAYYDGADTDKQKDCYDRRKGPYLQLENMSAFGAAQIYANTYQIYEGRFDDDGAIINPQHAPLITDVYKVKKVTVRTNPADASSSLKSVNCGTPILYYKADASATFNDIANPNSSIYNIFNNDELVQLGTVKDQSPHLFVDDSGGDGTQKFYDMIRNPNVSVSGTGKSRPYKPDSFILISAGFDGVFGTNDDITNFEE